MGLIQAEVVLDGHQSVLKAVALGAVIMDIVGGHHARTQFAG